MDKTGNTETNDAMKEEQFNIVKADEDKQYIFGWAQVVQHADGTPIEDYQGDIVDPNDLEEAAYNHVLVFRDTGEQHDADKRFKGKLIESCVFTSEKQEAIGIPEGYVPFGWWVGYYVTDEQAWEKVKNGTYKMFSVEGTGVREDVLKARPSIFSKEIEKFKNL